MDLTFLLNLVRSGKDLSCLLDTSGRPVSFESSHQAGPPTLRPNPPVNVAPGFVMCSPKLMQDSPVMIVIKHLTSKKGFAVMKECQANMFNIFYMALFPSQSQDPSWLLGGYGLPRRWTAARNFCVATNPIFRQNSPVRFSLVARCSGQPTPTQTLHGTAIYACLHSLNWGG